MKPERLQQLDALLAEALELPEEDRLAFVRGRCGGDSDLAHDLEALLAASERGGRFDRLADRLAPSRRDGSTAPQRVGAYRIVAPIGSGGMGAVYLAERADGAYEHRVALKLLREDLESEELRARFLAERQILARISHPNIARLLDGGVTSDGRPYFVMEHVDGVPIDAYCDEHTLGIEERLTLFRDVCAAVHHAHRHLVVHRDLKPANVLVDAEGVVKLLDFGIAKPLEGPGPRGETRPTQRLMTPEYASPEQLRGEPVTTASDVYQLGVMLYELLTGRQPFAFRGATWGEVERRVTEGGTEPPSMVVGRAEEWDRAGVVHRIEPEALAAARATTSERLKRALRGDLDTIVLAAIRPEPDRRYSSAERLADDIARHQTGHPVLARADTIRYRTSKFVRRNRIAVGAAAAGVLGIFAFALAMGQAAERTAAERDRAEEVSALLVDLFWTSAPGAALADSLTSRTTLDEATARVREELNTQPEMQARLLGQLSAVYRQLAAFDEAIELRQVAIDIRRGLSLADDPDLANDLSALVATKLEAGRGDGVIPDLEEAIGILRGAGSDWEPALVTALGNLAFQRQLAGDYVQADSLYGEVLAWPAERGAESQVGIRLSNRGWVKRRLGELRAAEALFEEAIALRRRVHGPDSPEVINSELALLDLLLALGDRDRAEPLAYAAVERAERIYGQDHPRSAEAWVGLAGALALAGDPGADAVFRRAEELRVGVYGDPSAGVAAVRLARARVALGGGLAEDAAAFARQALADYRAVLGEEHLFTTDALTVVGSALHASGRLDEAELHYREAIDGYRAGAADPLLATVPLTGLAELMLARGDRDAAEPLLRDAADLLGREPLERESMRALRARVETLATDAGR